MRYGTCPDCEGLNRHHPDCPAIRDLMDRRAEEDAADAARFGDDGLRRVTREGTTVVEDWSAVARFHREQAARAERVQYEREDQANDAAREWRGEAA